MSASFYFIGAETFKTDDNREIIRIVLLETSRYNVYNIYKTNSKENQSALSVRKMFDNVTDKVSYVIKRDGKISLDIKLN